MTGSDPLVGLTVGDRGSYSRFNSKMPNSSIRHGALHSNRAHNSTVRFPMSSVKSSMGHWLSECQNHMSGFPKVKYGPHFRNSLAQSRRVGSTEMRWPIRYITTVRTETALYRRLSARHGTMDPQLDTPISKVMQNRLGLSRRQQFEKFKKIYKQDLLYCSFDRADFTKTPKKKSKK